MSHSNPAPTDQPSRFLDRCTAWWRATVFGLPVWPFFLGIVVAFGACAYAGRVVSGQPLFENFVRFFSPIQPQRYFYPTASQLVAHIRATVPRDKTLVLVGGASYFRGTGQNPADLWSLELQRQLGRRYVVVNFATDQADLTAFAAVAFEILAKEYPKMFYVANGSADHGAHVDGGPDYRYIFWDAYYKGLLPPSVAQADSVQALRRSHLHDPRALETHLGQWLDQFAYASDLWTHLAYTRAFTVWTDEHRFAPFQPRRHEREGDDPHLAARQAATRLDAAYVDHSERHAKNASRTNFLQNARGQWEPDPAKWANFEQELRAMFPAELRPRIVVVLLRGNPFFMQTLTDEERERNERIYQLAQEAYERTGYRVVQFRPTDFTADDYIDGGHLMASGGAKVARAVAAHLETDEMARETMVPLNFPAGGPAEIAFALPSDRKPRLEPLFSVYSQASTETISLEYLGGENLRLIYRAAAPNAPVLASPPFQASIASAVHTLRISLGSLYPRTAAGTAGRLSAAELAALKSWLLVRLDSRPFWEVPLTTSDIPPGDLLLGTDPRFPADRFTGTFYSADRRPPSPRALRRDEVGGARLTFTVASPYANRALPLATTGKAGAGDVLFLRPTDKGTATLGYDHWGAPPIISPEFPFAFDRPHTVEFHLPALDATHPPEVTVTIDGQLVWRQRVPFYRADPDTLTVGRNTIGASTAEAALPPFDFENVLTPNWRG
jgi:hypothetical protein